MALFQFALEEPQLNDALAVDPFAMEFITENIAAYGVLLLRVAGDISKGRAEAVSLEPEDLVSAVHRIQSLTKAHNESTAPQRVASIYSSSVPAEAAVVTTFWMLPNQWGFNLSIDRLIG